MSVRERLLRYGVRGKSERMRVERAKMYKRERGGDCQLFIAYLLICMLAQKKKRERVDRKRKMR
jgi:hypothetical protein